MKHQLRWFINRINKRIYRGPTSCQCATCTETGKEGVIIHDKYHAEYLHLVQYELDIDYSDKPLSEDEFQRQDKLLDPLREKFKKSLNINTHDEDN